MTSRPDEADDADIAEQQRPAIDDDEAPPIRPAASPDAADEADALEQGTEVVGDDYDY
jgi:hypothetical protein